MPTSPGSLDDAPGDAPAPEPRDGRGALEAQRAAFLSDSVAALMLEAMPGPAMVLNARRQILTVNGLLARMLSLEHLEGVIGLRPGEAVHCLRAAESPGGCGTSTSCAQCGAARAILEALHRRVRSTRECRILTSQRSDGGALDLRVHASPIRVGREDLVVVGMEDVSGEKRRHVLERVFLHDLLNTCGGLHGLAELLADGMPDAITEERCKSDIVRLASMAIDEIQMHRQMLKAERGELRASPELFDLAMLMDDVVALYAHHDAARGRSVRVTGDVAGEMIADVTLLRRVLGNLVKNALEATPEGGEITLTCGADDERVVFTVHNPGTIPVDVQRQIFQRSFTTKGGEGRGIGAYSVKLFTERHLGGTVAFTSTAAGGTTFAVTVPRVVQDRAAA